jgi:hypothetical protein
LSCLVLVLILSSLVLSCLVGRLFAELVFEVEENQVFFLVSLSLFLQSCLVLTSVLSVCLSVSFVLTSALAQTR